MFDVPFTCSPTLAELVGLMSGIMSGCEGMPCSILSSFRLIQPFSCRVVFVLSTGYAILQHAYVILWGQYQLLRDVEVVQYSISLHPSYHHNHNFK
jgi:hypothetical protein